MSYGERASTRDMNRAWIGGGKRASNFAQRHA